MREMVLKLKGYKTQRSTDGLVAKATAHTEFLLSIQLGSATQTVSVIEKLKLLLARRYKAAFSIARYDVFRKPDRAA